MIPGSNILQMAFSVIATQTVSYYKFLSRTLDAIGLDVATYAAPVTLRGSFQPVPRTLYQQYGLDFSKSYFLFYTSNDAHGVTRDSSGDKLVFNGLNYQCEAETEWFAIDGWAAVLCVLQDAG